MNIKFANEIKKTNLYFVQNGIGKVALFTNLIDDLSARDNNKISLSSSYSEIFEYHPKVQSSSTIGMESSELFSKYFDKMIYREPYFSEYNKNNIHILKLWRQAFDIESENFEDYTDIHTNDQAKLYHKNVMDNIKKPYIIIQLKGGTTIHQTTSDNHQEPRNYNDELKLITNIHDAFKDYFIMVLKTRFDVYDERVNNLDRICTVEDESILILQELVNNCSTFVSIDSCVQHLACNRYNKKPGVVLWSNATSPFKIGHELHVNLQTQSINKIIIDHNEIIDNLSNILNYAQ